MRKSKFTVLISYCLIGTIALCGCGNKGYEAPELIEPVSVSEAYRPVEYGSVGDVTVYNGVVAPREYCHFFLSTTDVTEVKVNIGDYVEAGDVIAVADTESVSENISTINGEISLNNRVWDIKEDIYEKNRQSLEYSKLALEEAGDVEGANAISTELAILDENYAYDKKLKDYMLGKLQDQLSEAKKLESDGYLVARHSGYVTYIKDFSDSDMAGSGENVVVLSDYDDTYIKLDVLVSEKIDKKFKYYYAMIDGKRYELELYDYSQIELTMAQSKGIYPNVRMRLFGEGTLPPVGSDFSVLMYNDLAENVLVVGKDSLYEDGKGDFVYVRTDTGKEMRYIEIGKSDKNYVEVLSGLSEGEFVYYSSSTVLPESHEEYEIVLEDYEVYGTSNSYMVEDSKRKKIFSEYEGQVTNVYVEQGEQVEAGQLICTVKTNEGSALLTEKYNSIKLYKDSHSDSLKAYEEAVAAKEKEIEAAYIASQPPVPSEEVPFEEVASAGDVTVTEPSEEAPAYEPYLYERLCIELEIMKLNHEIENINYEYTLANMQADYNKVSCNNDGNGTMSIYAGVSGKLSSVAIKEGKNIYVGDRLFNIEVPSEPMVSVRVDNGTADVIYVNQKVVLNNIETKEKYTGTVIGTTGSSTDFYFTDIDGKIYITTNSTDIDSRYYIRMEDGFFDAPEDYTVSYPAIYMKNAIVVPKNAVYMEEQIEKVYYYVWKIVDGEYVKQYVQVLPTESKMVSELCILSGLEEGDIIAVENVDNETEKEN